MICCDLFQLGSAVGMDFMSIAMAAMGIVRLIKLMKTDRTPVEMVIIYIYVYAYIYIYIHIHFKLELHPPVLLECQWHGDRYLMVSHG